MPVVECTLNGRSGFKYGASGTCYTHDGTDAGRAAAKKKAVAQAIAIGGGKAPRDLEADEALVAEAIREYAELETVDLEGVEIMAAGGPVHGVGSPPEGDHWTPDDLRAMAQAAQELGDELKPPAKIGHDGSAPRVGWLDRIRVSGDGQKLVADVRDVPRKFAELVKAGAYRSRSAELARVTSQRTGKRYDWAVSGLAWLGAKLPAVRTLAELDDVVALYEQDGLETARLYEFENPEPPAPERLLEAIVELSRGFAGAFEMVETLRDVKIAAAADTRAMATYTDEQRRQFAEATGLEADKVTDEMLAKAGVSETPPTTPPEPPKPPDGDGDPARSLEQALTSAAEATSAVRKLEEELRVEKRRAFVEEIVRSGKEPPGRKAAVETIYDKLGDTDARKHYEDVKPDPTLVREYGSDEDGSPDAAAEEDKAWARHFEETYGHDAAVTAGVVEK